MSRPGRLALLGVLAIAILALVLQGCGGDLAGGPLGPCGDDARSAGGFPELEALLPASMAPGAVAPDRVDSGRSCSEMALSTLKTHGVTELRYAGATWEYGQSEATVVAVLATPNWVPMLEEAWVEEWYEQGARNGKKTDNVETSRPTIGEAGEVFRVDALNDLSLQTVVTWQDPGSLTHVVVVASDVAPGKERAAHDERVELAVLAAASPGP